MSFVGRGILTAVVALPVLLMPAPSQAKTDDVPPAIAELRTCIAATRKLDVLMVIDESSSLVSSDPSGARVDGVIGAIDALISIGEKSGGGEPVKVSLMLAAFADSFEPVTKSRSGPFVPVGADTRKQLTRSAEEFRQKDQGDLTDFSVALEGAVNSFAERSTKVTADGSPAPCKAMVLFTDGELFLEGDADEDDAREELCRPGGLADSTRASGIVSIAVALIPAANASAGDDPLLMQRIVVGTDDNGLVCGTTGSDKTGVYLEVADVAELIRQLGLIFEPPPPPPTSCQADQPCEGVIEVPELATGFRFRATSPAADPIVTFTSPDGTSVVFEPPVGTTQMIEDSELSYQPTSAGGFAVNASVAASDVGAWQWEIRYPGGSGVLEEPVWSVALDADIQPILVSEPTLIAGRSNKVEFALATPAGPLGAVQGATLDALLIDEPTGERIPLELVGPNGDGIWRTSIVVERDVTAGRWRVELNGAIEPAAGLPLPVAKGVEELEIRVVGAIRISPGRLTPASVSGTGSTAGELVADASDSAGGCVWIKPGELESPKPGARVTVSSSYDSPGRCTRVDTGETVPLSIHFDVDDAAVGTVSGQVEVVVVHDDPDVGERTVLVSVSFEQGPVAQWRWRLIAIASAVALFALIALAVLHLMAAWSARFAQSNRVLYWSEEVRLESGTLRARNSPERQLQVPSLTAFDLVSSEPERPRTVDLGLGFELNAAPRSWIRPSLRSLFLGPTGEISADTAVPVTAGTSPPTNLRSDPRRGRSGVLLSLRNQWVYVADNPADPRSGRLTLFVTAIDPSPSDPSDLVAAATQLVRLRVDSMVAPTKHSASGSSRISLSSLRRARGRPSSGQDDGLFDDWPG